MDNLERPKEVFIDFHNRCNFKCIFCSNSLATKRGMRLEDFEGVFNELTQNASMIDISGWGEVSIHPDFLQIIEKVRSKGKRLRMVTNGLALTEETIEMLSDIPFEINFSINSVVPETFSVLHKVPKSAFKKVEKNLKSLISKSREKGNSSKIICSFVMNTKNFGELQQIIDWAKEVGVNSITLFDLTPTLDSFYPEGLKIPDTKGNRKKLYCKHISKS
jgi:MoaA/NifB/PqqE/SkfB family radical SAM enzyme